GIVVVSDTDTIPFESRVITEIYKAFDLWNSGNFSNFLDFYLDKDGLRKNFTKAERYTFQNVRFSISELEKNLPGYPKFNPRVTGNSFCLAELVKKTDELWLDILMPNFLAEE
ncbi:MAG: hypothetical protein FWG64_02455, partial [Firmicutes bacterium]|nr:hypothetical protein [Bacillota bacterium]